jgi:hypothetical protein
MAAMAGRVVTETSTPTRVLECANVSDSTPATAATLATMALNTSGCEMNPALSWLPNSKFSGMRSIQFSSAVITNAAATAAVEPMAPTMAARAKGRPLRCWSVPRHGGNGAVLRADDHGADDEDARVGEHTRGGDDRGHDEVRLQQRGHLHATVDHSFHLGPQHGLVALAGGLVEGVLHTGAHRERGVRDADRPVVGEASVDEVGQQVVAGLACDVEDHHVAGRLQRGPGEPHHVGDAGAIQQELQRGIAALMRHEDGDVNEACHGGRG